MQSYYDRLKEIAEDSDEEVTEEDGSAGRTSGQAKSTAPDSSQGKAAAAKRCSHRATAAATLAALSTSGAMTRYPAVTSSFLSLRPWRIYHHKEESH